MPRAKRKTLQDIAREAKVSLTAASFFINGRARQYGLSDATCARLAEVIAANHYVPNRQAQAVASRKSFLIGVMIASKLNSSFWADILGAMEATLGARNYHLLLSATAKDEAKECETLRFMLNSNVDGLIIHPFGAACRPLLRDARASGHPVVVLASAGDGLPRACNDDYAGGKLAAEYLLQAGHRRIAYIGWQGHPRVEAYCRAMAGRGLPPVLFDSETAFWAERERFTAVMCIHDYLLLAVYQLAATDRVAIPGELSVIGYDRLDFTRFLNPAPATVEQAKEELGRAAGELMLELLDGDDPAAAPERVLVPKLIPGASVGAPRE